MYSTFNTYNPTKEDLIKHAPESATHYSAENEDYFFCWYKADGDKWMYKYAEGNIYRSCNWKQDEDIDDSRLKSPIPSAEVDDIDLNQEVSGKMDDPVSIRERILEIRKQRESGINEEQELVKHLASMGFQIIDDVNEKVGHLNDNCLLSTVDMTNVDNWEEGDLFVIVPNENDDHGFEDGQVVRFLEFDADVEDYAGTFEFLDGSNWYWVAKESLKFHSRPSK